MTPEELINLIHSKKWEKEETATWAPEVHRFFHNWAINRIVSDIEEYLEQLKLSNNG